MNLDRSTADFNYIYYCCSCNICYGTVYEDKEEVKEEIPVPRKKKELEEKPEEIEGKPEEVEGKPEEVQAKPDVYEVRPDVEEVPVKQQEIPQPPPLKPLVDMPPVPKRSANNKEPEPNRARDPRMSAIAQPAGKYQESKASSKPSEKVPAKAPVKANPKATK